MSHDAYGDESESDQAADPGTYVMAAALPERDTHEYLRDVMSALRQPGQRKLHWHDESPARRRKLVAAVAALPVTSIVVVRAGPASERPERRRAKCLERLAYELVAVNVRRLCLEAREARQNARDRALLQSLRSGRVLTVHLHLDHASGPSEPLLWIADIVAGAVVAARLGVPDYLAEIERRVRIDRL